MEVLLIFWGRGLGTGMGVEGQGPGDVAWEPGAGGRGPGTGGRERGTRPGVFSARKKLMFAEDAQTKRSLCAIIASGSIGDQSHSQVQTRRLRRLVCTGV